jgi:hypothetical protein
MFGEMGGKPFGRVEEAISEAFNQNTHKNI